MTGYVELESALTIAKDGDIFMVRYGNELHQRFTYDVYIKKNGKWGQYTNRWEPYVFDKTFDMANDYQHDTWVIM